jgi:GNAT superfamily N-acetyltransferase
MSAAANPSPTTPADAIRIRAAVPADAPELAALINAAFVVERVAFHGDRIDLPAVQSLLIKGTFLIVESPTNSPSGPLACVYLEPQGDRCYLGLLSVAPALQGKGLGRELAGAAENFARKSGCRSMYLRIVSPRAKALLPIYAHLGYTEAETTPFPADIATKIPCHYIRMTKSLA